MHVASSHCFNTNSNTGPASSGSFNKGQAKLLLRVAAFVAKFDDLPPCIFRLQIQPGFHQLSPILALPTHRDALDLFLNHAPPLPKRGHKDGGK